MSKSITPDIVSQKNAININTKQFIIKKVIIKEPIKEEIKFNYFPITTSISEPALEASNPQIHSDSQSRENCCLYCTCFICFIPAMVGDIISCPVRLCYKLF